MGTTDRTHQALINLGYDSLIKYLGDWVIHPTKGSLREVAKVTKKNTHNGHKHCTISRHPWCYSIPLIPHAQIILYNLPPTLHARILHADNIHANIRITRSNKSHKYNQHRHRRVFLHIYENYTKLNIYPDDFPGLGEPTTTCAQITDPNYVQVLTTAILAHLVRKS